MATLKERVDSHPAVFFLGAIVAGFVAGFIAYRTILEITNQVVIPEIELETLHKKIATLESQITRLPESGWSKMSEILFDTDRHGSDIGGSVPKRYPGECLKDCADNSECLAWAFEPPEGRIKMGKCWLKRGIPEQITLPNYASGTKVGQ